MSREYQATAAAESGAGPVADYQFRVPSPPHITVPPFCDEAAPVLPPYVGYNQGHGDEILKHVTQGNYQVETTEWKYPWRREAQAILAFLYLGPASIARNMDFLKKEGITMLLVVRDSVSAAQGLYNGQKAADELGIPSIFINVTNNQDLIRAFPVAIEKINQHLEEEFLKQGGLHKPQNQVPGKPNTWGKILVFCESGNERSPAVVAAYLMAMYHIDLIAAIQYIQQRRFCVSFDDPLKNLLLSYHDIIVAQRSTLTGAIQDILPVQPISHQRKRRNDEVYEDDHPSEEQVDGRLERQFFSPFASST